MGISLEDLEEIKQLLYAHCFCVDTIDADGWAAIFTEDGSFGFDASGVAVPNEPIVGRAALREYAAWAFPRAAGVHISSNEIVAVDGDTGTALSYAVAFRGESDPQVTTAAQFNDRVRRVDGKWLIEQRMVTLKLISTR